MCEQENLLQMGEKPCLGVLCGVWNNNGSVTKKPPMPTSVGHYAWRNPQNKKGDLCWSYGVEVIHNLYNGNTWECGV